MLRRGLFASSLALRRVGRIPLFTVSPCLPITFTRFFAAGSPSRSPPPSVATSAALARVTDIKERKADLMTALQADAEDLTQQPNEHLERYIKDNQFKIVHNEAGGILINRVMDGYQMTLSFDVEPDEDMSAAMRDYMGGQPGSGAGGGLDSESDTAEEGTADSDKMPQHTFDVDLKSTTQTAGQTFLRLTCYADAKGELVIDSLGLDPEAPLSNVGLGGARQLTEAPEMMKAQSTKRIDPGELSDDSQTKLHNFLNTVGVNDELAQFVQYYAQLVRTQMMLKNVKALQDFLRN